MLRKRRTAVAQKRNMLGKLVRGRMSLKEIVLLELAGRLTREDVLNRLDSGLLLPARLGFMGAAEANINTVMANPVYFPKSMLVTTDQTILQGDMVWWDDVHYTLKQLTLTLQVAYTEGAGTGGYCGVAQGTNVPGVYPNPPSGVSENLPGVIVQRGGTVKLHTTTGDGSYFPMEPVTVGATQQTVTRGGETSADRVGRIIVPLPTSAAGAAGATPAPPTQAAGSDAEVWVTPQYPTAALL